MSGMGAVGATVLDGTASMGGHGRAPGSIAGAFVVVSLVGGMVMMGASGFWQIAIKDVAIATVVVVD